MTAKTTGDDGRTERILGDKPEYLKILIGEGEWQVYSPESAFTLERDEEVKEDE